MYLGGKNKIDKIEESLNARVSEGNSVTHIVRSIEKSEEAVFNLKIKGSMP